MFLIALQNVGLMLLMAIPGFIIVKLKAVDGDKSVKFVSVLLLYVCQPFITFDAFLNISFDSAILVNMVLCFVLTALLMTLIATLTYPLFGKLRLNECDRGIYAYASAFGNIGYMCVPFLQILAPDNREIIIYAGAAIVAFNLVAWTLGNYLITHDKRHIKIKNILLNPPTLAFLIVLPLFLFDINFVRFPVAGIQQIIDLLANLVGPLAMVLVGMCFANANLRKLFTNAKAYIAIGLKLVISPLIAFLLLKLTNVFFDTSDINLNIIALAAMPSANNLIMFCSISKLDTEHATALILLSTLISIVTIPLALELLL
ncbi:MAG: AEC family transporter [Christensenellaceae bacterium]|jgi:predicted permease|nr:AEC family transporter [Christensenellaceae bacterium]